VVQQAEVTPIAETFLVGLLAVALIAVLTRSLAYGWSQYRGYPGKYPHTWSAAQCRALEYFRVLVGVGLLPLWGLFCLSGALYARKLKFGNVAADFFDGIDTG